VLWGSLALGASAVLLIPSMPTAVATVLLSMTLLVAPGALLTSLLPTPASAVGRWAAALASGVAAVGAPYSLMLVLGVPAAIAGRVLVALVGILAALRALRPGTSVTSADVREWWPALVWSAVVAALLSFNPSLPPRADGWFHAGVTLQLLDRLPPPEDPYFAGLRLLYFWGMHLWASLWSVLSPGMSVWTPWIVANVAAAAATLLAVSAATRSLGAAPRTAGLAAAFTVLAWSPLGWLQLAARAVVGDVRGWPEVRRLVSAGVDPLMDLLARGQLHASMAFHGDKALVLTPFGMGLALFALALTALVEMHRSPRRAIGFGVFLAAALFTHTVAGDVLVLLAGASCVTWSLAVIRGDAAARTRVRWLVGAVAAGAALMVPYVLSVSAGKHGQVALGASAAAMQTLVLGTGAALALALLWLRTAHPARGSLLMTAGVLLAAGLFVDLPESNQSKFFNFLMIAMMPPAAMQLDAWLSGSSRRSVLRWGMLACLFLPTPLFCLWAFAEEHGQSRLSWHEPSQEVAALFRWAGSETPRETVFADLGGARELFTISGRSVLWGGRDGERDWGHAAALLDVRRRAVRSLCVGAELRADELAMIRSLGRPIVVVSRQTVPETATARRLAAAGAGGYRLLREGGGVALLAWASPQ